MAPNPKLITNIFDLHESRGSSVSGGEAAKIAVKRMVFLDDEDNMLDGSSPLRMSFGQCMRHKRPGRPGNTERYCKHKEWVEDSSV